MKLQFDASKTIKLPNIFSGPALERLKKSLFAIMLRQKDKLFREGVDPDGKPWTPLSLKAARRKEKKNRKNIEAINKRRAKKGQDPLKAHQILVDTGALKNSLTNAGAPYQVQSSSPFEVVLGTNLPYARIHNDGGIIRRRTKKGGSVMITIPQRRFMGFSKDDNREIKEKIQAFIAKGGK